MDVHIVCGYRSKNEDWNEKWKPVDWRARNLVKALKKLPFNGFAQFSLKKGSLKIDNSPSGQNNALQLAAARIVMTLNEIGLERAQIVAIPSSSHTVPSMEFTGSRLSDQIAAFDGKYQSCPVLHFKNAMAKSATGGGRNEMAIYAQLRQSQALDERPVVLIDDVFTSGAHFRAAKRFLNAKGIEPNWKCGG